VADAGVPRCCPCAQQSVARRGVCARVRRSHVRQGFRLAAA
jgi:hypothetical protein